MSSLRGTCQFDLGQLSWGVVETSSNKTFDWLVTFDDTSGNEYQAATHSFDFDLSFGCGSGEDESPEVLGDSIVGDIFTTTSILGTNNEKFGSVEDPSDSEVRGVSCEAEYYRWWAPLVVQGVLLLLLLIIGLKNKSKPKKIFIIVLFIAIISQVVHKILGCSCATGIWCERYWIFNLVMTFFSSILSKLFAR
ncbi:hypothetical protein ISR94_03395 [Candidatus Microgenomates bacterium]|nr:hypothetical protein [Candidatus Microgenomates bacterium]